MYNFIAHKNLTLEHSLTTFTFIWIKQLYLIIASARVKLLKKGQGLFWLSFESFTLVTFGYSSVLVGAHGVTHLLAFWRLSCREREKVEGQGLRIPFVGMP